MKDTRHFPKLTVTPKAERSVRAGHPWIYHTELIGAPEGLINGALVDAVSQKGAYLGTGFLSLQSKIRIRLLSRNANDAFDERFFRRRVSYALRYRQRVMGADYACCRLIFGEADGLPGLTVDRYGDLLVAEVLSVGMEQRKDWIYRALLDELSAEGGPVRGIYERNESPIRELEGLEKGRGWAGLEGLTPPDSPVTEITENGVRYLVDVQNGQKTGFFLDQKYNRGAVAKLCAGLRVLDCFTHTGSFALNAALGGAGHVTAVDSSHTALRAAEENARLNGLSDRMAFVRADVFDLLPRLIEERAVYDLVILDPPAFSKSRGTRESAQRGYKEINYRAMKLLPRGGFLATCSCSHFMTEPMFLEMLMAAAKDAEVSLRLIETRHQSPDHPVLLGVPETSYLKFYLFQIL